ncbi:hypothetical protein BJ138DRAFT_1072332, partial [Hygrophoropsis aurantiaca]
MHLPALNITDLFLGLWRGVLDCDKDDDRSTWDWAVLQGDTWTRHGKTVANATPYLPGSFDRPPRNPAEKISSGYKAWEFLLYMFSLGPGLFFGVLPDKYWHHFCKLVFAVRLLHQRSIPREQLQLIHTSLVEFYQDFELLYYQRKTARLHFCRQSLHALLHLAPEVTRLGPPVYYTQWTMERTIGNLGEEIKQPSDPYTNLSRRGLRRSQVNALFSMIPSLNRERLCKLPRGAEDLGDGFLLLRARDTAKRPVSTEERHAIQRYIENSENVALPPNWCPRVRKWARIRLPNGQVARSAWKENQKPLDKVRMARNVKFRNADNQTAFGEVQYYFYTKVAGRHIPVALVSLYSAPDKDLLRRSHQTLWVCKYQGIGALQVIDVKSIVSVVAMVPFPHSDEVGGSSSFFVAEKPGLEVAYLGGVEEECP